MSTIRNNTPRVIFNGIKDESIEQLFPELEEEPIHLPLLYGFSQRGPVEPVLCGPNGDFRRIFGKESQNIRSPYYTHVTKLMETVAGAGNSFIYKRLIPDDALYAGMTLFAKITRTDTLATGVLNRKARNGDGSFVINNGRYMYITTTPGTPITAGITDWTVATAAVATTELTTKADGNYRLQGLTEFDVTIDGQLKLNNGHIVTVATNAITAVYKPYQTKSSGEALALIPSSVSIAWEWLPVSFTNGILHTAHTTWDVEDVLTVGGANSHTLIIPVKTMLAISPGAYGNNIGYREWINETYASNIVEDNKSLVLKGQFVERPKVGKPYYILPTLTSAASVDFTYNPSGFNEDTEEQLITDNIVEYYNDDGVLAKTSPTYGPCGELILHDAVGNIAGITPYNTGIQSTYIAQGITRNIDIVYQILADVEAAARASEANQLVWDTGTMSYVGDATAIGDFDVDTDAMLLNIFTGESSNAVPYYGFTVGSFGATSDNGLNESSPTLEAPSLVNFDNTTIYWFGNGNDGTLTNTVLEEQLIWEIETNYNNPNYDLTDTGRYPFSAIYDSGFTYANKEVLFNWLGYRKDVHVTVGTHAEGERLDIATEENRAAALSGAAIANFAESEEFGTQCVRCVIIGHSSEYIRGSYKKRLPLTHELALKRATYLGAGNGVIKYGSDYTLYPLNTLTIMNPSKTNNVFMKPADRETIWTNGANFVMWSDRSTVFIPALQTIYNPRNSVLTSELIMQIAVDVEKQCDKVWKLLSGNTDLTPDQFLLRSNEELTRLTSGKYGSRVVVTPNAYYTQADTARGYSWVMEAIIYGNVMKTVATVNVIVRRNFD